MKTSNFTNCFTQFVICVIWLVFKSKVGLYLLIRKPEERGGDFNWGDVKKDNARNSGYRLRLNDGERSMLEYLEKKTGLSIAEILRRGIQIQFESCSDISENAAHF